MPTTNHYIKREFLLFPSHFCPPLEKAGKGGECAFDVTNTPGQCGEEKQVAEQKHPGPEDAAGMLFYGGVVLGDGIDICNPAEKAEQVIIEGDSHAGEGVGNDQKI